jgi:hypothetical protein
VAWVSGRLRAPEIRFDFTVHQRVRLVLSAGMQLGFASQVMVQDPPTPTIIEADLKLWRFPVTAGSQLILLFGPPEVWIELSAALEFLVLKAGSIKAGPVWSFHRSEVFGYGPGLVSSLGIRWPLTHRWSLVMMAGYHLSVIYYTDPLSIIGLDERITDIPPRGILQGVEISAGARLAF